MRSSKESIERTSLFTISIIAGTALMALEIAGGRLLAPYFGGSVAVWGSVISVFLMALATGYYFGGRLADRSSSFVWLAVFLAVAGITSLLIPPFAPRLSSQISASSLNVYGVLVVAIVFFFIPSTFLGAIVPMVAKIGIKETSELGNIVGALYSASTFGSIAGALGTTFILIPLYGVREIIFSIGIVLAITSMIIFVVERRFLSALVATFVVLLPILLNVAVPAAPAVQGYDLIYAKDTMYNNIIVRDSADMRYLTFNDVAYESGMKKSSPNELVLDYSILMDRLASYYAPGAQRALVLGVGGGSIPKAFVAEHPQSIVDAVDIDPVVIDVAYKYFAMQHSPQLKTFAVDARMFLKSSQDSYDIAYVDIFNQLAMIPYHITTEEFFSELSDRISSNGVVLINVISSPEGEPSKFLKSLIVSSKISFPNYRLFMTQPDNFTQISNLILVLSRSDLPIANSGFLSPYKEYSKTLYLSDATVLTDNYAPVEHMALDLYVQ